MVDICVPFGPKENQVPMRIATVDLAKLGKDVKKNREKIKHVYVMGRTSAMPSINETFDDLEEA